MRLIKSTLRPILLMVSAAAIGACGDGGSATEPSAAPVPAAVNAIAAGFNYSCMLTSVGNAYCWGSNSAGQLGAGDTTASTTPRAVGGGLRFTQITIGTNFTCGLATTGAAYCWGTGQQGQLGNGTSVSSASPVAVLGGLHFESISAGYRFACGVQATTRDAYCWGDNTFGSLGVGDTLPRGTPTRVATGGPKFKTLHAGFRHVCALSDEATSAVYCWGWNAEHEVSPASAIHVLVPTLVSIPSAGVIVNVVAGAEDTCALASTGALYCWGRNRFGELGQGGTAAFTISTPLQVVGGVGFAGVSAGRENNIYDGTCAWTAAGAAYCWGINTAGQLGSAGGLPNCTAAGMTTVIVRCTGTPAAVDGNFVFVALASGNEHTCGITRDHSVMCWGSNSFGQLGNGSTQNTSTPTVVGGLPASPP